MADTRRRKAQQTKVAEPPTAPNSGGMAEDQVDLNVFVDEISARLVTAGSLPMPLPHSEQPAPQEHTQIIIFKLGSTCYAVDVGRVGEVVRSPDITPVPGLPGWVLGVTNLHGNIVSVVDLTFFLGVSDRATKSVVYMIVGQAADQVIGLAVDDIDIIYTLPAEQIISPPFKIEPALVPYIRGAIEHRNEFVRFLDCERLLLGQEMQQFG